MDVRAKCARQRRLYGDECPDQEGVEVSISGSAKNELAINDITTTTRQTTSERDVESK